MPDATHPTKGVRDADLTRYWITGPGLARWATNPHPYTALTRALRKEGVPKHMIPGLSANYFKMVFGIFPGQRPRNEK